jgi:diphthamide biosynthesis protein 3
MSATGAGAVYDEIEIEDMTWVEAEQRFTYPCPCGDVFSIALSEMLDGEDVAGCASCSLRIRCVFDEDSLRKIVGEC